MSEEEDVVERMSEEDKDKDVDAVVDVQRLYRGYQTRNRLRKSRDGITKLQRRVRVKNSKKKKEKKINKASMSDSREERLARMRSELLRLKALRASSRKRRADMLPKSPGEIRSKKSTVQRDVVISNVLTSSAASTIQRSWRRGRGSASTQSMSPKLSSRNIVLERQSRDVDEENQMATEEKPLSILRFREAFAEVTKHINSDETRSHHSLREDLAKEMIKGGSRKTDRSMRNDLNLAYVQQDLSTLKEGSKEMLKRIHDIVSDPQRARRDDLQKILRPRVLPKQRRVLLKMMQEHDTALRASRKRTKKDDPWWRVRGVDSKEYDLRHHRTSVSRDMKRLCDEADRILFSKSIDEDSEEEEEEDDSMWWITHCSPSLSKTLYSKVKKMDDEEDFWSDVSTTARDLVSRLKQSRENAEQIYADLVAEKEYRTEHHDNAARKLQRFFRRKNTPSLQESFDSKDNNDEEDRKENKHEDEDLPMDIYERLVQLAALRERNLLTDREFKAAKRVVLAAATD